MDAIITEQVTRTFRGRKSKANPTGKDFVALDQVDLAVRRGELFGLLGPNGAGKTTLIKILATLLMPTSGRALVGGFDVARDSYRVKRIINMVSGGETSGYGMLTVREQLWMFSQFYGVTNATAFGVIDPMLATLGMADSAHTRVNKLSTGMRQKMNVVRGFLNDPEILFLDEPTLGLDVSAARIVRALVRRWLAENPGKTVLLTTHYMAEADELCDRVAIIDRGRIVACDTPANLKRKLGQDVVLRLELAGGGAGGGAAGGGGVAADGSAAADGFAAALQGVGGVRRVALQPDATRGTTEASIIIEGDAVIPAVIAALAAVGATVVSMSKTEATLEDVFLELVGRKLRDNGGNGP